MTPHVVSLPMRVPFRGVTTREAVLFEGPAGWGEWSPFFEYDDAEASRWLRAAREAALVGWPAPVRSSVSVNATVPAVAASQVLDVLARFAGCTTAKVKVCQAGQTLADDVARVAAVRDVLGPTGKIRVDANAGWTLEEARRALDALGPYDLEYAEQPCASLDDLRALRGRGVLIAADESIRKAADPLKVAVTGAADVVVLKVAPLGGVASALEVARACGLPVVVSSALDTSVGIAAGVAMAAALPDLPYACGLGTVSLFAADVTSTPMRPVDGALSVGRVEPDLRDVVQAAPDRERWWRERLARCEALLDGESSS